MKSKKLIAIIAGAALMMPLAACGNKAVATTSGGKITESEYYSSMKQTSAGKQVLQQMILDKVLEKQYGKEGTIHRCWKRGKRMVSMGNVYRFIW